MPLTPKCPRCNLGFGTRDPKLPQCHRTPLMLDCGHTFCGDCLGRLAKQQRTSITCPTCKATTALTEECSIQNLWPNVYIHGLLIVGRSGCALQPQVLEFQKPNVHVSIKAKPKQNCEECSVKIATCRCTKCDVILCGVCFEKIHRVSNVLRQHQAEPFNARSSDIDYGRNPLQTCDVHKCCNEYYCTDDDVAFCSACIGQGMHRNHSVITVEDKEKADAADLNVMVGQANSILNHSKQSSQLLGSMESACQAHGLRLIEKLQEHFFVLHSSLQAREHYLINELVKLFQKDLGSIAEIEVVLREQMKKIELLIGDAKAVVAGTRKNLSSCQVIQHMRDVVESPCHVSVAGGGNLQIQYQYDDKKLVEDIGVLGHWDGRFVSDIKVEKLCNIPLLTELEDNLPLMSDSSSVENSTSEATENDQNATSLSSEAEQGNVWPDSKTEPKEKKDKSESGKRGAKASTELVHVSHICNPCNFYVNLARDIPNLTLLSQNINNYCNHAGKREIPTTLDVGDQVLAQFGQDGQWYRAQVIEYNESSPVNPATFKVMYVDYGNTELVTLDRIRNTHPKFNHAPRMAKHCSLVDIIPAERTKKWSTEAITTFARITKDRPMLTTLIKETDDLWYVDLSRPASREVEDDGPASVRDVLVFLNMACFISSYSLPLTSGGVKHRQYLSPIFPKFGESMRCVITFIVTPHEFYIQMLGSEARHLQELMINMQKTYEEDRGDLYSLFCPVKGMLCVAQYHTDKMWYRAEIVDLVRGGQVNIRYVDYGNVETVSIWKLKKLLDTFVILPAQAICCRLADIAPVQEDGLWQQEAVAFMAKLLSEPELTIKVKEVVNRSTLSVYLQSDTMLQSVNTSMISNGWALATGAGWEPPPATPKSLFMMSQNQKNADHRSDATKTRHMGSQPNSIPQDGASAKVQKNVVQEKPSETLVIVSHMVSPGEFFVQDVDKTESLEKLMSELNTFFTGNQESKFSMATNGSDINWRFGDICAISSPVDKKWYRAKITKNLELTDSAMEVFCFDYGYKFTADFLDIHRFPDYLKSVSPFSVRCHFAEIAPAGDPNRWSQTSVEAMKSLVADRTLYLVEKGSIADDSDSLPVDLMLEIRIKGGAVTPDVVQYQSVADSLREKGLALKKRLSSFPRDGESKKVVSPAHQNSKLPSTKDSGSAGSNPPSLASSTKNSTPNISPNRKMASGASPSSLSGSHRFSKNRPTVGNMSQSNMNQSALEMDEIVSQSDLCSPLLEDYPPPEIPACDKLLLGVTHVDQDCVVYGQEIKADLRYLQQLMDRVQNHYRGSTPIIGYEWREGQLVVAQYTEDDGYYRAKILSLANNFAEVYYTDYGNRERLSVERLRHPLFVDEPAQCYRSVFHGLKLNSTEKTSKFLYSLLVGKVCTIHIKRRPELGLPLQVQIFTSDNTDLSDLLCRKGFTSEEETASTPESVKSESVNSPQHLSSPVQQETSKEEPIRAQASAESSSLEETNSHTVICSTSNPIPPAFPHPSGYGWTDNDDDSALAITPSYLELKAVSLYRRQTNFNAGELQIVSVTQVDTPTQVYLQRVKLGDVAEGGLSEINKQLDQLLELNVWYSENAEQCNPITECQLKPGQPCLAKYSVDDCWYRAEIVNVLIQEVLKINILFVDYGSCDCITDLDRLRVIPEEHLSLPTQATLCCLDGLEPRKDWTTDDVDRLDQLVKDRVLVARIKGINDGLVAVDLFDDEVYRQDGASSARVYHSLIDDNILVSTVTDIRSQSDDDSELSVSETCRLQVSSKSSVSKDETADC